MFDFYEDFVRKEVRGMLYVSVRGMLVKCDFISKLVIKHKASKSKTSLAKEKRVFYRVIIAC